MLLFPISSKGSFISHRQENTLHGLCHTSCGALAGTINSSMGPPHEGSIRQPIASWVNALTTELHVAPCWRETGWQVRWWMNSEWQRQCYVVNAGHAMFTALPRRHIQHQAGQVGNAVCVEKSLCKPRTIGYRERQKLLAWQLASVVNLSAIRLHRGQLIKCRTALTTGWNEK